MPEFQRAKMFPPPLPQLPRIERYGDETEATHFVNQEARMDPPCPPDDEGEGWWQRMLEWSRLVIPNWHLRKRAEQIIPIQDACARALSEILHWPVGAEAKRRAVLSRYWRFRVVVPPTDLPGRQARAMMRRVVQSMMIDFRTDRFQGKIRKALFDTPMIGLSPSTATDRSDSTIEALAEELDRDARAVAEAVTARGGDQTLAELFAARLVGAREARQQRFLGEPAPACPHCHSQNSWVDLNEPHAAIHEYTCMRCNHRSNLMELLRTVPQPLIELTSAVTGETFTVPAKAKQSEAPKAPRKFRLRNDDTDQP